MHTQIFCGPKQSRPRKTIEIMVDLGKCFLAWVKNGFYCVFEKKKTRSSKTPFSTFQQNTTNTIKKMYVENRNEKNCFEHGKKKFFVVF